MKEKRNNKKKKKREEKEGEMTFRYLVVAALN